MFRSISAAGYPRPGAPVQIRYQRAGFPVVELHRKYSCPQRPHLVRRICRRYLADPVMPGSMFTINRLRPLCRFGMIYLGAADGEAAGGEGAPLDKKRREGGAAWKY
jgi:hypothetical protein